MAIARADKFVVADRYPPLTVGFERTEMTIPVSLLEDFLIRLRDTVEIIRGFTINFVFGKFNNRNQSEMR